MAFVDGSRININITRIYGRCIGGVCCVGKTLLNTPTNTTILSSIRINGENVYTAYSEKSCNILHDL